MSVAKRKTSSGTTAEYHYDFSQAGKRYRGVCEGCTTERAALAYEKEKKEFVKKLASQKTATALVENFRQELTGSTTIPLNEAYALYESKPRPKLPGTSRAKQNRRIWEDFCAFMRSRYPEVLNLAEITRNHAEEYLSEIRADFQRAVYFKRRVSVHLGFHYDRVAENVAVYTFYHRRKTSVKRTRYTENYTHFSDRIDIVISYKVAISCPVERIYVLYRRICRYKRCHNYIPVTQSVNI